MSSVTLGDRVRTTRTTVARPVVGAPCLGMASCQFMLIAGAHASLATWVGVPVCRTGRTGRTACGFSGGGEVTCRRVRGIRTVIPEPADQAGHRTRRGRRGGRPVRHDPVTYRGPNVIERAFNRFKNWRALATRYDKHATIYRRGLLVASLLLWLRD